MKRDTLYSAILILLCFSILDLSCKKNTIQPDIEKPLILPANASGIIQSNKDFAFDFLHTALQNDVAPSNKMVSPLSIYMALSMLYNGANYATRDSIQYALRLDHSSAAYLNNTCSALLQQLPLTDNAVNLSIANSIWYDEALRPLQSFLNVNDSFYNARIQALNFSDPSSVTTINNWVSQQTKANITKIINQLSGQLLLINAIYFKGSWENAFDKNLTANASFKNGSGNNVSTPFMSLKSSFNYLGNDSAQIIQLPYGGGNFNMYVLLPGIDIQATQLAYNLNSSLFAKWQSQMDSAKIQLYLPKFQYSYSINNMQPELSAMGMGIAFSKAADFTNIYPMSAQLNQAIHKTYISVDESGTVASAVTAIGVITTVISQPIIMNVNKPFLYVIQEKSSGLILFIGIVNDPTQS